MDRYRFTVEFWDEFDKKMKIEGGYVIGDNFAGAMEQINKYYGESIEQIHLKPECDSSVIIAQEDMDDFDINWKGEAKNFYV